MKNVYEIFDEFEKATNKQDKINILRYNQNYALKSVLKGTFDPNVEFTVKKIPKYKPSLDPAGLSQSSLLQEMGRMYLFEKNNPRTSPNLTEQRKEQILIQMLETLEAKEAQVLESMLLKKPKVKGLTYNLVKEAFPDILP